MNEYSLREILLKAHEEEFSEFDSAPFHFFSFKHRKAMKEIFSSMGRKETRAAERIEPARIPFRLNRRTVHIFLLVIILALFSGMIKIFYTDGFFGKVYYDYIHFYSDDKENAPRTIDVIYYPEAMPEGYECTESYGGLGDDFLSQIYINEKNNFCISFEQCTKERFNPQYDNEHAVIVEMKINGYNGFIWEAKDPEDDFRAVVWDNGDYIFEIIGKMSRNDIIDLAKSTKIIEN